MSVSFGVIPWQKLFACCRGRKQTAPASSPNTPARQVMSLPMHPDLSEADQHRIVTTLMQSEALCHHPEP